MKIKHIKTWKENLDLVRPYTIAYKTVAKVECVFVLLEADNGSIGIGAANPSKPVVGKNAQDTLEDLESMAAALKNIPLTGLPAALKAVKRVSEYSTGAFTALDIALHDLFCHYYQVPIVDYYGKHFNSLPTSITIGIKGVEETLTETAEYVGREFDHIKVKLGHDLETDIERLAKMREQYGNRIKIRVDANQGYSIPQMNQLYERTKTLNLELIEQPVLVKDALDLESLPIEIKALIAADESLVNTKNALDLVNKTGACGIFNIKLMKCGGIRESKVIAEIGALRHIDLMWGCNDESIVSISAALHSAMSCPNTKYLDLDGSLDLAKDMVTGGFRIEKGRMYFTGGNGLGVQLL